MSAARGLVLLSLALLAFRVVSAALVVVQPGFTDAYYYANVARRLAHGEGLTADFIWNFIEAPGFAPLPIPSHRFWMPLTTVVQAIGIVALEPALGTFRAAQAAIIAVGAFVPAATYFAARAIGGSARAGLVAAALVGIGGGTFAPAWVTLDSFAIAALVGTLFFVAFARAAEGDVRAGALAGLCVGLLFLARAEGALFGVALLWLGARAVSRGAGLAGSAVALLVGAAWVARGVGLGGSPDLFARTALLWRYEDFFAVRPSAAPDLGTIVGARASALAADLGLVVISLLLFLVVPVAIAIRARWGLPVVRAFAGLALLLYLAESLVWTLHATRGSYFHSLAALFPFATACAAAGGELALAPRGSGTARVAALATLTASAALALFGLALWGATYNPPAKARAAALDAIPPGPFVAIDAATWRWIADRPVVVTPADGPDWAFCAAARYGARSVVLEPAHFSSYDDLYRGGSLPWLGPPIDRDGIRIYPVRGQLFCGTIEGRG